MVPGSYGFDFTYTNGPIDIGNGVTFSSTVPDLSSFGTNTSADAAAGYTAYSFTDNGTTVHTVTVGLEDTVSTVTLRFAVPVESFGAPINYAIQSNAAVGNDPVISAYDSLGGLIASYDLETTAPIRTPGGVDTFAFRGISSTGALISSFTLSGASIAAQAQLTASVPEPATWAILLAGMGAIGLITRRRGLSTLS